MKEDMDIHNYKRQLESATRLVQNSNISKKNKEIIFKFRNYCTLQGIGIPRRIRYLGVLKIFATILKKDFDRITKADIEKLVRIIQEQDTAVWTKYSYKVIIKRFYKWLKGNDEEYPAEVKWIKVNVKRSEQKLPSEGDLLTERDIKKLIKATDHPRDKALVSMLYESGCRIGELASMQVGNVEFDKYGVVIVVKGKTGSRKIRLIASTSYLSTWMQNHPFREDKKAPLWLNIGIRNNKENLHYDAIRMFLKRLFKKAGINKRHNPHLFRHSRATFLANHLTEFQMNQYLGWIQGSNMPAVYVHLSGKETDAAILELNGVKTQKQIKESALKPKKCQRCDTINSYDSKFCSKCAGILDISTAIELEEKRQEEQKTRKSSDDVMNCLIQDEEFRGMLIKKVSELKLKI